LLYVSQVCRMPEIIGRAERVAIHRIWHFATNALTTASYLHLHNVGAPRIRSGVGEIYATQLRTAWRFKEVWQGWLEQIKNATDCYGNLITVARDELTPDFWDHPPIAQILSEAWHGTPLVPIKAQVAALVKSKINLLSVENPAVSREGPKNKITVQKWAYPEFLRLLYPDDLALVLQRRLQKILGSNFNPDSLAPALLIVKSLKPHVAVQVLKTWSNAWATTHRFHEARRLPCLFGCPDEADSLNHCALCPYIKSVME
jgi:hypothetical protein